MAGFDNDTMHADNVDFRGVKPVVPQVVADGQLLIGATVFPNIRVGTLTAGSGISISNGPGTITITNTGGMGPVTGVTTLNADSGSATQVGGIVNVFGGNNLATNGVGQTLTIEPTDNLLGLANLAGTGYVVQTGAGTFTNRTFVAGSGITLTNADGVAGATTITATTTVPLSFTEDSGTAVPAANNLNIIGTSAQGISTSGAGSTVTLTIADASAIQKGVASFNSTEFTVAAGVVTSNALTITAGTGLTGGGSVNLGGTVTVNLDTPVSVAHGGTGDTTLTLNGVLYGNTTSPVGITSAGTNGQVLIAATGAAPAFATILGTNGITFTTGANALTISNTNIPNGALQNSSITLNNGNNITVTGSPVSLGGSASIAVSGTTNHAVQIGNSSGSLTSIGVGTNGQVLIGASAADPAFATLTSSDSSITFTTGANTLDLKAATPSTSLTKLTPDEGGAVTAVANNINVLGIKDGATAQVTMTHNQSSNFTIENRAHLTPYVVDAATTIGARGTFTTIAAAITAAVTDGQPRDIFIKPGTYTENLTLSSGINLTAFGGDELTPNVTIIGKCSFSDAGTVTISNIRLQTNSDFFLAVTGSQASILNLINCYLNCTNNTGISFTSSSSSAQVNVEFCSGDLGTTGISYMNSSSAGAVRFLYGEYTNSGSSTTSTTCSAGSITMNYVHMRAPISCTSTGVYVTSYSYYECASLNTTAGTFNGTGGNSDHHYSKFSSGSASAISIGSGASAGLEYCAISSSNTNAITGLGTLNYGGLIFDDTSATVNTTTQNPFKEGPRILVAGGCQIISGSGSPNGVVTAPKGSLWLRTDGSSGTNRAFLNTNGGTTWTAINTVA